MSTCFLDWTESALHIYSFEKKRGECILSDIRTLPIDGEFDPATLSSVIQSPCDNIFLSLPVTHLSMREVSFPFHDRFKIESTIAYELEGLLLGNAGDYSVDTIITGSSDDTSTVLAVCMEKTRLRDLISSFAAAGFDPKVITSLDIRIAEGKGDRVLLSAERDREVRAEAAREEVMKPTCNLRQDELMYVRDIERVRKVFHLSCILLLVLLLFIGSNIALSHLSLKEEHAFYTREMYDLYQKAFPQDGKIVDPLRQFRGNLNALIEKRAALAGVSALNILRTLAEVNKGDVILREFHAGEKNITIKGSATSFEEVESYKNNLSASFDDVRITDSKASADEAVIFSIVMKGRPL